MIDIAISYSLRLPLRTPKDIASKLFLFPFPVLRSWDRPPEQLLFSSTLVTPRITVAIPILVSIVVVAMISTVFFAMKHHKLLSVWKVAS
jgi:hypothetical protein